MRKKLLTRSNVLEENALKRSSMLVELIAVKGFFIGGRGVLKYRLIGVCARVVAYLLCQAFLNLVIEKVNEYEEMISVTYIIESKRESISPPL